MEKLDLKIYEEKGKMVMTINLNEWRKYIKNVIVPSKKTDYNIFGVTRKRYKSKMFYFMEFINDNSEFLLDVDFFKTGKIILNKKSLSKINSNIKISIIRALAGARACYDLGLTGKKLRSLGKKD